MTMQGKHVLITGGNTGIGKATAIGLARMGAAVTITSRDPAKGEAAVADIKRQSGSDAVELMRLDLASLADVRRFAAEYLAGHPRLDVLINNAGLVLSDRSETADGFETTFAVNHLGHFLLTHLLLDRLKQSAPSRIVVLASDAHRAARGLDFDDLQARRKYSAFPVYCRTKLANLLFTLELAERLRGTGVTVNAVHPGVVASGFGLDGDTRGIYRVLVGIAQRFMITPEQGARTSIYAASAPELERTSGQYFIKSKQARPTRYALDRAAALRLWEISEQLTGIAKSAAA
ncbi:NAD(P)-dependent dehydrogenase, short-chain alcohol dehydrogenase family [Nannocystis exedens]|uniref:NAD(P)-dependent dehydrogenase, short-chain alcohol dehydrogenase family n=1 Tax=Nannocystis exedens TaxID=54 RepID=A0A1I1U1K9_9BACT|nr:SDR family oxidoreductase [Nannocystis exedens]PCC71344.1 (S)-1-Phenylethanol dehydrogenase [Nannocystis exedens]SFD64545.1 NAD(P)-dependent dehydrogenase, short-chain alcohol dehydrogenase family [Nannocystis exedens]